MKLWSTAPQMDLNIILVINYLGPYSSILILFQEECVWSSVGNIGII